MPNDHCFSEKGQIANGYLGNVQHGHMARDAVNDDQHEYPAACRHLIVHKVHGPGIIRAHILDLVVAELVLEPPLRCPVAQLYGDVPVNPVGHLQIDHQSCRRSRRFTRQQPKPTRVRKIP
jgi:hypothetical protein